MNWMDQMKRAKLRRFKVYIEDIRDEFREDFHHAVVKAGAVYEHKYLLGNLNGSSGNRKEAR